MITDGSMNNQMGLGQTGLPSLPSASLPNIASKPSVGEMENQNTFLKLKGGLDGIPPGIAYPGYLYPSNSPDIDPTVMINNQNPEDTAEPKPIAIKMAALSDDSQLKYDAGDLIFIQNPLLDVTQGVYVCYALWNLNYGLEMAARKRAEKSEIVPVRELSSVDITKRRVKEELYGNWPVTVEEFMKMFHFYGSFISSNDKKMVRKRSVSIAPFGRIKMPCIFVDEKGRFPGIGDVVGLKVKPMTNSYPGLVNLDGKVAGSPTPGKFLQVTGYWEYDCKNPIRCTTPFNPSQFDIDFAEDLTIEQTVYDYDENGLINTKAPIGDSRLTTKMYQEGFYIRLGRVVRRTKDPSPSDIEAALRSKNGWVSLSKYSLLEIELKPLDDNLLQ